MFYCLMKLMMGVGLIAAINPTCKKVALELRCLWEGYKSYSIPEGTLFLHFDRFFKSASLDLPNSVKRLRIEDTDYSCSAFEQIYDVRLNGVSCPHEKTEPSSIAIGQSDTTPVISMDQTEISTKAAMTNSPVVKVNVTLLPILGSLNAAQHNNCPPIDWTCPTLHTDRNGCLLCGSGASI